MSFFYPQNLLTAVPFWGAEGTGASSWEKAAAKQTYRMQYCNLALHQVAIQCRYDRMLPLLMERPTGDLPEKVLLMRHDAPNPGSAIPSECADVTALFTFDTFDYDGKTYVEFPGQVDINQATTFTAYSDKFAPWGATRTWASYVVNEGFYSLVIEFPDESRLYSELLQISDFPEFSEVPDSECLSRVRIECVNSCSIGPLPPVSVASQKLFSYNVLISPEYITDLSLATNGLNQSQVLSGVVKKRWRLTLYGVETVADFCSLLPLFSADASAVNITDQYGVGSNAKDIEVQISWPTEFNGCLAQIDIYFTRDYVSFDNCCE